MDENIGKIFGDFKIIEKTNNKNNSGGFIYKSKCIICGTEKYETAYELKRNEFKHSIYNCRDYFIQSEIGNVYGDLKIVEYDCIKSKSIKYIAKCQICGREKSIYIKDIRNGVGISHKNCTRLLPKNKHTKRLRSIFPHIIDRCTNPNCEHYNSYGGRGIKCEYEYFVDFYDDMYESYIKHVEQFGEKKLQLRELMSMEIILNQI